MNLRILLNDSPAEAGMLRLLTDGILTEASFPEGTLKMDAAETTEAFCRTLSEKPFYYDVLILSYHFGRFEKNGVPPELVKLRRRNPCQILLFATSCRFLPLELAELQCAGILKKPFERENARHVLKQAAARRFALAEEKGIPAHDRSSLVILRPSEILYGRKGRNNVRLFARAAEYTAHMGMDLFEMVAGQSFFRCHNSFIVNLRHVRFFDGIRFHLVSGEVIPVSRRYQPMARSLYLSVRS